ncbi:LRR receptor-like serine/threonine-protein kinase RGI1 [Prosopis cineraria]|uniref:LRR receptor-like serine/threonine-protein kinase RGI1 n=1 Tax=Prosopis cineraria TaxID=364024 RepID=UPI00240F267A|nr:LRR receptor-like serine/threonine-protein kinase RGI1 [Prosopis cineraria]
MGNLYFHFSSSIFSMLCLMVCPSLCHYNFTLDGLTLLAFKSSIRDPYNHLKNWSNSSSSFCNWFGVTCDPNNERVRILSLPDLGLEGTLPLQIGNLSFLEKLELQSNNFHGGLPKELLQLRKLEILNLSYNTFSGEIPTWIGSLFMLQHLSLGNNSFGGLIPPSICNLSNLETLDLKSNSINGSIPVDIGRLQHLKFLSISRNMLSGSIPPTISNLSSLEHISLSLNFLEGHIPKEMNKLTNLKNKYIGMNQLSGQIPSIGNLFMLENLYLASNSLQGNIPNEISNLTNLNSIYLSFNQLSGHIPRGIGKFTRLEELVLDNNNFEGNIPNEIVSLANLKMMGLSVNQLSGPIPRGIGNLTVLQQLYLGSNNLEDKGKSKTHTETISTIGYIAPEYGSVGMVSTKVDVYSYGILLMEVFTRKKPTEGMFVDGLSLKTWISESMSHALIQVMDSNLLQGDEQYVGNTLTTTSTIFKLALTCCTDFPTERCNMLDVVASLNKIKDLFVQRSQVKKN